MASPGGYQQYRSNMELDAFSNITDDTLDRPLPRNNVSKLSCPETAYRIGCYFLLANLITMFFTIIPVLVELPDIYLGVDKRDWYGIDDLFRLAEPLLVAPVQFLILIESLEYTKTKVLITIWFAIGMGIYQQGAGFHSASNMIKHAIESVRNIPGAVDRYPIIEEIFDWTRDVWQHIISHYMYAGGGIIISFCYQYVFINFSTKMNKKLNLVWLGVAITYGLMIAAVGAQYPKGPIVALVLCVVVGGTLLATLYRNNGLKWGSHYVLQSYLLSYILAFVIVLGYGIMYNFKGRNEH